MGADLYIESVYEENRKLREPEFEAAKKRRDEAPEGPARQAAQDEVEAALDAMYSVGYFRDSYNQTSLLWRVGLSWWQDVGERLTEDGKIPLDYAEELIEVFRNTELRPFDETEKTAIADPEDEEGWMKYFEEKRDAFIALLEKSIELNEPIYASI